MVSSGEGGMTSRASAIVTELEHSWMRPQGTSAHSGTAEAKEFSFGQSVRIGNPRYVH
jgi:hypothetical protein